MDASDTIHAVFVVFRRFLIMAIFVKTKSVRIKAEYKIYVYPNIFITFWLIINRASDCFDDSRTVCACLAEASISMFS